MEKENSMTETVDAEVIGGEFSNYEEFKQEFDRIIHKAAESFVEIGYMLRIAQDTNLLREAGYKNMEEFAKAEYGIDKSQASRFININRAFSEGGYSRVLQTRYQGMGVAKLGLMLTLPMSINEELTPDFSKEEIRAVKEEVDEEKKITELEVLMEGEKESQTGLSTMLEKAVHQLCEDDPGLFLVFWRYAGEYMQQREDTQCFRSLMEELAPSGDAIYFVRIQGTGRVSFSFKDSQQTFSMDIIRQETKETHYVKEILEILLRMAGDWKYDGREAWERIYGREIPIQQEEEKPDHGEKKAAPKKEGRVMKARTGKEKTEEKEESGDENTDTQIAGQFNVEDYPEYLPEGYEKEKVAPVQPEEKQEEEQENVIKTGTEAETDSRENDTGQQAPSMEEDAVLENAVEEAIKEAAALEGMSLPEPEWGDIRKPSRTDLVSEIRQLAVDIADTVIENAFHVDTGRMRKLELAKENAGRLETMIGELIEKEAYQE